MDSAKVLRITPTRTPKTNVSALLGPSDEFVTITARRDLFTIIEKAKTASQRTSERVFGIPRRHFLSVLPLYRGEGGHVAEVGKLRIVDVDAFAGWLARRAAAKPVAVNDNLSPLERELGLVEVSS